MELNKNKKEYFPLLDLAKFIFCILIFCYHFHGILPDGINILSSFKFYVPAIGTCAWYLDFFFVSAGFCVASSKIVIKQIPFKRYFLKHYSKFWSFTIMTIIPAFFSGYLIFLSGKDRIPSIAQAICNVFMVDIFLPISQYDGPLWFLSSLLVCYSVFYLIIHTCESERAYIVSIVTGSVLFFALNFIDNNVVSLYTRHIEAISSFLLGAICYEIHRYCKNRRLILTAVTSVICVITFFFYFAFFDITHMKYISLIMDIFFSSTLVLSLSGINVKHNKLFKHIGGLSTSVYIWHIIPIYYVVAFHCNQWIDMTRSRIFVDCAIVVGIVSLISHFLLEPFINKVSQKIWGVSN